MRDNTYRAGFSDPALNQFVGGVLRKPVNEARLLTAVQDALKA